MDYAIQGLGWLVRRSVNSDKTVMFYRDQLGLADLRSGEYMAMLWAGGTSVLEPNRGGNGKRAETWLHQQVTPVFACNDLEITLKRLQIVGPAVDDELVYLCDPGGNWLALESSDQKAVEVPFARMADGVTGLSRIIVRSHSPMEQAAEFHQSTGLGFLPSVGATQQIDLGEGIVMQFAKGDVDALKVHDREQANDAIVFRTYDLKAIKSGQRPASPIGEVIMPGGSIAYYQDTFNLVFGFQERIPPDPDIPTSRLVEDIYARSVWSSLQT